MTEISAKMDEAELAINSRIRAARVIHNMSITQLAEKTGISANALSNVNTGRRPVTAGELGRIAKALKMSPGNFFEEQSTQAAGLTRDLEIAQQRAYHEIRRAITQLELIAEEIRIINPSSLHNSKTAQPRTESEPSHVDAA